MKADDEAEFRSYAAAHMRGLRRTAFLLCGDWHHADDVVQTVRDNVRIEAAGDGKIVILRERDPRDRRGWQRPD